MLRKCGSPIAWADAPCGDAGAPWDDAAGEAVGESVGEAVGEAVGEKVGLEVGLEVGLGVMVA